MSDSLLPLIRTSVLLALLQGLAALPWLTALGGEWSRDLWRFKPRAWKLWAAWVGGGAAAILGVFFITGDPTTLERYGRGYATLLHLQLVFDLFAVGFAVMLWVWSRGGAVALAAFRESVRQPMFLVLLFGAAGLLTVSMVIPYFTFGDDYKMMKQIGFDACMLAPALFGVLAASISIHDEIEGRTAVTLMSKPVTRRQFLLGKYLGILLACAAMTLLLGIWFNWMLHIKPYFDRLDDAIDPMPAQMTDLLTPQLKRWAGGQSEAEALYRGIAAWSGEAFANTLGLLLDFGQVMVLLAIAAALATRFPMVINLVLVLVVFFLGHLSQVLVAVTSSSSGTTLGLVGFIARLFETLLPALSHFDNSAAVIRENPLDVWMFAAYSLSVTVYAIVYSTIALLFGLILFEDRDLA